MAQWDDLQNKFNELPAQRRRFWLVLSVIFVMYLGAYILLFPVWKDYQTSSAQTEQQQQRLNLLRQQLEAVEIRLAGEPKAPLQRRLGNLQEQIAVTNQRLQNETNYVSAADNRRLLQALLASASELSVKAAQVLPAEKVYSDGVGEQNAIYKHRLQLVFSGEYQEVYHYFRQLEELPWSFYWQRMDYDVVEYPEAQIILEIYTLSLEPDYVAS
jgi:MSHA biogenesis protein MshJ